MSRGLQLCLVQTELVWEDPVRNRRQFEQLLGDPGAADLIVLPEMFSTGFSMNAARLGETMQGETVSWMQDVARRTGAAICGSVIIEAAGSYYNRFVLARPGGELVTYDKRHLFRMSTENNHYTAGSRRLTTQVAGFKIFPQVCYDLRFPVFSRNNLGFDVMIYVANWPARRRDHWRTLLAARAIENQCYVVGVNRIGTDGNGVDYAGDSLAVQFDGSILVDMGTSNATTALTLSQDSLEAYRQEFPAWKDADAFTLEESR